MFFNVSLIFIYYDYFIRKVINMSKDIKEETFSNKNITIEEKTNKRTIKPKSNKNIILSIIIILLVLIIVILSVSFFKIIYPTLKVNLENTEKEKIELKYTETTSTNNSDNNGIYITDVSEVVENVMPSIVAITSKTLISSGRFGPNFFGEEKYSEGAGSGIIISKSDENLMILTNNHVVEGANELSVQFINEKSYDAKIVGTSERKDIAIISVSLNDLDSDTLNEIKIATLGDSNKLKVGNGIIAIGNALGYGQSVTTGVVSALNREVSIDNYTNKMIQLDAAINGGNSGGALLNSSGEIVGINSAKYSSSATSSNASVEGMGFAIPISDVNELITTLMNGENDEGVTLGIEGYIVNDSNYYNMPIGFYISKITSGSSADKSELEIGNIITKIDGNEVTSLSDLQNVLNELNKGDKVTLTISYVSGREYKEKDIIITLS